MKELDAITSRLRGGTTLAGLLDAAFDTFEVIRLVARASENLAPDLFAAFITTAGTAVEGRNALNDAPSLPPATRRPEPPPRLNPHPIAHRPSTSTRPAWPQKMHHQPQPAVPHCRGWFPSAIR